MSIKMSKKQIQNERVESNLRVLKLLSNNDPSINEEQKREVPRGFPNPLAMFVFSSSTRCDLLTLRYSPPNL